ncbi:hypothetical protein F0U61_28765 [Archangium violaceum]|uniref:hypothetical protein n=1 Tax=Archangium violaceum TaxID=83451 RepID=UPI002B2B5A20|nr:hypothetical protein F0U61_28765 [Archangium violaceum]
MNRWTLGVACVGLLFASESALAAPAADVFERARLAKYASKAPGKIFEDPQISCYLRELLTKKDYDELKERMDQIALRGEPDATGAFHFEGNVPGLFTEMEGIVLIHPGGRLWVAYIAGDEVSYFTNDPGSFQKQPQAIDAWRERFKDKPIVPVSAQRKVRPDELAQKCGQQKLAAEMERFNRLESGTVCQLEGINFSPFHPAVVKGGAPEGRVYFYSEPEPCPSSGECKSRKKAYLVENDAVELSVDDIRKNGFVCARYRGAKGSKTAGWLTEAALSVKPLELPAGRAGTGTKPADWVGTWSRDSESLTIRATSANRIEVVGMPEAQPGMADPEESTMAYTVSGPLLLKAEPVEKGGDEPEPVRLRLLNNAIFAECTGCAFNGLYFRK